MTEKIQGRYGNNGVIGAIDLDPTEVNFDRLEDIRLIPISPKNDLLELLESPITINEAFSKASDNSRKERRILRRASKKYGVPIDIIIVGSHTTFDDNSITAFFKTYYFHRVRLIASEPYDLTK